jgi:hypothetical protein
MGEPRQLLVVVYTSELNSTLCRAHQPSTCLHANMGGLFGARGPLDGVNFWPGGEDSRAGGAVILLHLTVMRHIDPPERAACTHWTSQDLTGRGQARTQHTRSRGRKTTTRSATRCCLRSFAGEPSAARVIFRRPCTTYIISDSLVPYA